jgi:hypothetical protein
LVAGFTVLRVSAGRGFITNAASTVPPTLALPNPQRGLMPPVIPKAIHKLFLNERLHGVQSYSQIASGKLVLYSYPVEESSELFQVPTAASVHRLQGI